MIQRRYEALGALNDIFIAIWFLVGSILFLSDSLMESGTWLFVVGSAQFLIKPCIKLMSLVHVKRVYKLQTNSVTADGHIGRHTVTNRLSCIFVSR
ncbi:YrhK family protein [Microbulbifer hainanensis]|uniref:YrhK family protein n=1 Tax=Microbulbifer hainanensis TaxID=2735675 RepID=UPI003857CAFC